MLINVANVSKTYGARTILHDVSFQIRAGERVGLVGANGCGKTTLLRIVAGGESPDSGAVARARGVRIGYLEQEPALDPDLTVFETALGAFDSLREIERQLREVEQAMAESAATEQDEVTRLHGELLERFEREGGYGHEARARAVLAGVGFAEDALDRKAGALSGGERSRAALARLLLTEPDLLLLDEPTNHLDLAGVEWLEKFLARYPGGVLAVSHDRLFLDRAANAILELTAARIESFPGNYTRYREVRAARQLERQRRYEKQQEFIEKEEAFIRRYGAGQRAREAKGRKKRLERVERVERPAEEKTVRMGFGVEHRSGETVFRVRDLALRYGDRLLFGGLNFELAASDRVGVVGPNGCGKTSLLKMLLKRMPPSSGTVEHGHKLRIGYYDQLQEGLHPERTVLDEVWEGRRKANESDVRDLLALFRFTGDDINKRISDLSGGERGRAALARLMIHAPNVLVLDEPTHHLDIPSREALEDALRAYGGTVLAVSHDRFFLNNVMKRTLAFEPPRVRTIDGTYELYESIRDAEARGEAPKPPDDASPAPVPEVPPPRQPKRTPMSKNRFAQIERRIMELEEETHRIDEDLQNPAIYADGDAVRERMERRAEVEEELEELNAIWEEAAEGM